MGAVDGPAHNRREGGRENSSHVHVFHGAFHRLAASHHNFQKTSKAKTKMKTNEEKQHTRPLVHMQVRTRRTFTDNQQSLEVTHTSLAGAWHAHLRDGRENRAVRVALANQVNYPVCELFDGAPVQLVVLGRLQRRRNRGNGCQR